jgi:DNA ligase-4
MLSFDTLSQSYEPFGTLKTTNNVVLQSDDPLTSKKHPSFVIFDILYFNGHALTNLALEERFKFLGRIFQSIEQSKHIKISDHEIGHNVAHIYEALKERLENGDEGLVIKNPSSKYSPGEKKDWIKVKPEYIDSMNDDIDLVIVGGYFGKGKGRRGQLSAFLCAALDRDGPDTKFVSFCKFGSGFKLEDLPSISMMSGGHWKKFDKSNPPEWFIHIDGKENPDMIIEPWHSQVAQVRGSQICDSSSFGALMTLRFPRFKTLRLDKSIDQAASISELKALAQKNNGRFQSIEGQNAPTKSRKRKQSGMQVLPSFKSAKVPLQQNNTALFAGMQICVRTSKLLKDELETEWMKNGGDVVQNVLANTNILIFDKSIEKLPFNLRHLIKRDDIDILNPLYIRDCLNENRIIPIGARYIIHASSKTKKALSLMVDKYGDNYEEDLNIDQLKTLFDSMPKDSFINFELWEEGPEFIQRLSQLNELALFLHEQVQCNKLAVFLNCIFYLDVAQEIMISPSLQKHVSAFPSCSVGCVNYDSLAVKFQALICEIRGYGGTVMANLSEHTTHVIIFDHHRKCEFKPIIGSSSILAKRFINDRWIQDSIIAGAILDEKMYS